MALGQEQVVYLRKKKNRQLELLANREEMLGDGVREEGGSCDALSSGGSS